MVDKELTKEEKEFIEKELLIKFKDIISYNPHKVKNPIGMKEWNVNDVPTEEYAEMMSELVMLVRYVGMKISEGCPEVQESMTKRCASASLIINELVQSIAIDGWHMYGLASELHQNVFMELGGKAHVINIIKDLSLANQALIKKKMSNLYE